MQEKTVRKNDDWEKSETPLEKAEIRKLLKEVSGWRLDDGAITKDFRFGDFKEAISFVNGVAEIAERENHHPEIQLRNISNVKLKITTYCIGGLSRLDFSLASKIDGIAGQNDETPRIIQRI